MTESIDKCEHNYINSGGVYFQKDVCLVIVSKISQNGQVFCVVIMISGIMTSYLMTSLVIKILKYNKCE